MTREDFSTLLAAGQSAEVAALPEYASLLTDSAIELLINQVDPPKYVQQADADWLIALFQKQKNWTFLTEADVLTNILRYAVSIPASLADFAVQEIEKAIVQGHTSASGKSDHVAGVVSEKDVEALRLAVFAATEGSSLHVSRTSAEALFRIAEATAESENAPGFDDFFAKAVGNYLMGIANHWTPSAADAVEREKWLDGRVSSFRDFLGSMLHLTRISSDDFKSVGDLDEAHERLRNLADAKERQQAETIDPSETRWLMAQLTRDGKISAAEQKLLAFLKQETNAMPTQLGALLAA